MGPDESKWTKCYLTDRDGNKRELYALLPKLEIDFAISPTEIIPRVDRQFSGTCTLKVSERYIRRLKVFMKTTLENRKLMAICRGINKFRIKKKLAARICRNLYKQVRCR